MRPQTRHRLGGWLVTLALVATLTGVIALLNVRAQPSDLAMLYLLAILPVAAYLGTAFGLLASALSFAAFDFLFIPPEFTFKTSDSREWLPLAIFPVTALVVSQLANRSRQQALASAQLATEQAALRRVATLVAQAAPPGEIFETVTREISLLCGADLARLERYEGDGTVIGVAAWARDDNGGLAVGTRFALSGVSIAAGVWETNGSIRVDSFADAHGPIALEARAVGIRSSVGCPIHVGGRLWGVIAASSKHDPFPADTESQISGFTELVATAVSNAVSRGQLAASRARVVASADATRQRIERDLHDGIQQRLVTLGLALQGVRAAVSPEQEELLARVFEVERDIRTVIDELREISRGIHPAVLSQGGLGPALKALARRSGVPVTLNVGALPQLPRAVEVAAYYTVSEALTNATKHASASGAEVDLEVHDGMLELWIRDDGVGGADPTDGSGILGLTDRIESLGGTISLASPPGEGTSITLELPLESVKRRGDGLDDAGWPLALPPAP